MADKEVEISPTLDSTTSNKCTFRKTFLFYLKENAANPRLLLKLMQIAKFFCFEEFPFLITKELTFSEDKWGYRELDSGEWDSYNSEDVWITESLVLECADITDISEHIPYIAVLGLKELQLDSQNITLKEFKFLTAPSILTLRLIKTIVKDENDVIVPVDEILKYVPALTEFYYEFDEEVAVTVTSESTTKIIEILKTSKIKSLSFRELSDTFDFDAFCKFLKVQEKKPHNIFYHICFGENKNMCVEYKQKLQNYIDKMMKDGFDKKYPVSLQFPGQAVTSGRDLFEKVYFHIYGCQWQPY